MGCELPISHSRQVSVWRTIGLNAGQTEPRPERGVRVGHARKSAGGGGAGGGGGGGGGGGVPREVGIVLLTIAVLTMALGAPFYYTTLQKRK